MAVLTTCVGIGKSIDFVPLIDAAVMSQKLKCGILSRVSVIHNPKASGELTSYKVRGACRGMRVEARQRVWRRQKMIERGKTDGGDWILEEGRRRQRAKGIFFLCVCVCVCLERMGASYTPHSVNLARAAASSRLHSGMLSWAGCPWEGHLQEPQTLVKRESLTGGERGRGGAGMERRCVLVPGNGHVLGLMKSSQVEHTGMFPERK